MPNFYEKVKFSADFLIAHELKKSIHPRPCGMISLSNIIPYGRGTLPNLIDEESVFCLFFSQPFSQALNMSLAVSPSSFK